MEIGKQRRQRTPREPLHPSACMFFVIFPSYYHSLCHTHEVAWCPYYPQKRVLHWRIRVTVGLTLHFFHAHTLPSIYILAFTTTNDLARNHSSKVLFFCTTASLTSSVHQSNITQNQRDVQTSHVSKPNLIAEAITGSIYDGNVCLMFCVGVLCVNTCFCIIELNLYKVQMYIKDSTR